MLNPSFSSLSNEYIFAIIDKKLADLKKNITSSECINLSIGDVALPLAPSIVQAITTAVHEMGTQEGLKGYPPTYGYAFLRDAIAQHEYTQLGIGADDIYISDGINSDAVNFLDLFHPSCTIGIPNPTYPAYFNSSMIAGRKNILPLPCLAENHFLPQPPQATQVPCDVVYLCSPNNPTGTALTRKDLQLWIDYAHSVKALLLIDSAYASFVTSPDVPKSVYEIPGAHDCAIEFKSFSKSAGFTGLRCAYTVIPKTVYAYLEREKHPVYLLWRKRQDIKFNGVAYPIQRGAEAALSDNGLKETHAQVHFYLSLAKQLKEGLDALGYSCWGGHDSPYIWWKTPGTCTSWQFFDELLNRCHLIAVPGVGFGTYGEGYIRLSAFSSQHHVSLALDRIKRM